MFLVRSWIGLLSLGLFALSFVLAINWGPLIGFLGGLAKQHRLHHIVGVLTLLVTLFHVGLEFYSVPLTSWSPAFVLREPGMLTGFVAFFLLLLVGITSFWTLRFLVWKRFHWLSAVSFCFACYHALAFSTHSNPVRAVSFMGGIAILALFLWHFIHLPSKSLEILKVNQIGNLVYSVTLQSKKNSKETFCAGMVVYLRFKGEGFSRRWHPFSVATCQNQPHLRLVIKSLGHDTFLLSTLKPGSFVDLHGPYSDFKIPEGKDQVWISGGIGIAPFIGMAQCIAVKHLGQTRLIHFSFPNEPSPLRLDLDQTQHSFPQFKWKRVEVPSGSLPDFREIQNEIAELSEPYFLLSGPPKFMRYIRRKLRSIGIPRVRIITAEFTPW